MPSFPTLALLPFLASGSLGVSDLCTEQNQPTFIFQHFWTDHSAPGKRHHEFWVDRDKDVIRAYWQVKGDKPVFLVGNQVSDRDFYLCAYRLSQHKPMDAYLGAITSHGIQLKALGKHAAGYAFQYVPGLAEEHSYSLRYETIAVKHQIIGKIPKDRPFTCDTTISTFQLVANPLPSALEKANHRIKDLTQDIDMAKETPGCLDPKQPPSFKGLGANLMFASDRYLSAKMDFSRIEGITGSLSGRTLNLDLDRQTDLTWSNLFEAADQGKVLKELNRRLKQAYGGDVNMDDLSRAQFSFNSQTLVISGAPRGVMEDRVDIPIPLDVLFGPLKIKRLGPFAFGN